MSSPTSRRGLILGAIALSSVLLATAAWYSRPKPPPALATTRPPQAPLPEQSRAAARKVAENHWIVADWARKEYLEDLRRATSEARLTPEPAEDPKKVRRLTITHLEAQSPIYLGGLRLSDEIVAVNGTPVETLDRAVNLLAEIRTAKTLSVRVRRIGREMDFRFDFE